MSEELVDWFRWAWKSIARAPGEPGPSEIADFLDEYFRCSPSKVRFDKSNIQIRRDLLNVLQLPVGTATVSRRIDHFGELIVVSVTSQHQLDKINRIPIYQGYRVAYEVSLPLKIGFKQK